MNDPVHHPSHYTSHPSGVECLALTRCMSFDCGNAVKYVWRNELKNGREDLEKAAFYLRDAIDVDLPIFIDPINAVVLLHMVIRQEEGIRREFFTAMRDSDLYGALYAVERMLGHYTDSEFQFGEETNA